MRMLQVGEFLKMGRVAERLRIAAGKLEGIWKIQNSRGKSGKR
jgi:hypothetical protein